MLRRAVLEHVEEVVHGAVSARTQRTVVLVRHGARCSVLVRGGGG
jgi:hypothetical protein